MMQPPVKKQCYFASRNVQYIDYKDIATLKLFISASEKIRNPKHSFVSARYQRPLAQAIKRARFMALLPFVRQ